MSIECWLKVIVNVISSMYVKQVFNTLNINTLGTEGKS